MVVFELTVLISALLQLLVGLYSLKLIKLTKHRTAWILFSIGFLLQALRRFYILFAGYAISGEILLNSELIGIAITFAFVFGIVYVKAFFEKSQKNEQDRDKLLSVLEKTNDLIAFMDIKNDQLYVNRFGKEFAGLGLAKPLRACDISLFHTKDEFFQIVEEKIPTAKAKGVWVGDTEFLDKDGSSIPFSQTITAHYDEIGDVNYISTVAHNISEIKQTEHNLRESEKKLMEINRAKDVFFSIISHDLRGPLSAVKGICDIIVTEYSSLDRADMEEMLSILKQTVDKEYNLLENLLQWARLQTGRLKCELTKVDLKAITDSVLELLKSNSEAKQIKLINKIYELSAFADVNMVNLLIRNLVSNAIKFTQPNGTIVVLGFETFSGPRIYIRDSGVGMSAETIAKLFRIEETFTSLGTENEQGSGLGLILCKEFITKHSTEELQCDIKVKSKIGKGTVFYFNLPPYINEAE